MEAGERCERTLSVSLASEGQGVVEELHPVGGELGYLLSDLLQVRGYRVELALLHRGLCQTESGREVSPVRFDETGQMPASLGRPSLISLELGESEEGAVVVRVGREPRLQLRARILVTPGRTVHLVEKEAHPGVVGCQRDRPRQLLLGFLQAAPAQVSETEVRVAERLAGCHFDQAGELRRGVLGSALLQIGEPQRPSPHQVRWVGWWRGLRPAARQRGRHEREERMGRTAPRRGLRAGRATRPSWTVWCPIRHDSASSVTVRASPASSGPIVCTTPVVGQRTVTLSARWASPSPKTSGLVSDWER